MGIWGLGTSCVLEMLDGLEGNKFAVVEEVKDLVVVTIFRSDIVGRMVVVVVAVVIGINVISSVDSTRGFCINLTLYCLLPAC